MAYFTPQGQKVNFPGRIGLYTQHAYKQGGGSHDTRFLVSGQQPGSYSYYGPGYSGMLYDYDPTAGQTPKAPTLGLSNAANYTQNLPAAPTYAAPTLPAAPTYDPTVGKLDYPELTLPEVDKGRMEFLSQKAAAPGLRAARGQMQGLASRKYSTPMERAKVMRQGFAGLGQAYEDIIAGSRRAGREEYLGLEFNPQLKKAYTEHVSAIQKQTLLFQAKETSRSKKFEAAWNTWKAETGLMTAAAEAEKARGFSAWKTQVGLTASAREAARNREVKMYIAALQNQSGTMYI